AKLIIELKADDAGSAAERGERPAVFQMPERAVEVANIDFKRRLAQPHAAGKTLLKQLIGDRHLGDDHVITVFNRPAQNAQTAAKGHEFWIALDISDERKHVGRVMVYAAPGVEFGHGNSSNWSA